MFLEKPIFMDFINQSGVKYFPDCNICYNLITPISLFLLNNKATKTQTAMAFENKRNY